MNGSPRLAITLALVKHNYAPNSKSTADWSAGEQAGVAQASEDVIQGLAQGNDAYYEKFGFVFLICATGKSAAEMLSALEARLPNDRATELQNAAQEHSAITKIRLEKL